MNKEIDFDKIKVLLVDDGNLSIGELKYTLEGIGFNKTRILIARDQDEAIKFAELNSYREPIELVIFSFENAQFSDILKLKNIKEDQFFSDIPVIVILSKGDVEFFQNAEEFKRSGLIFRSLIFTFSPKEIKNIITNAFEKEK